MNQDKLDAIADYLKDEFTGSNIERRLEFDTGMLRFRIDLEDCALMLKVGRLLLDDNTQDEIIQHLKRWEIPKLLRENSKFGIRVTAKGPYDLRTL